MAPSPPLMGDSGQEGPALFAASVSIDINTLRLRTGRVANSSLQSGHWGPRLSLLLVSQRSVMHFLQKVWPQGIVTGK